MHYYKRNLGDYAKKAGKLSMLQHGAYTLLTDACYDREKFPTKEEAIDWTWASTPEEVQAVEFVLSKFFVLENGRFIQARITEELAEYTEKSITNKRIAIERESKKRETNSTDRAPKEPKREQIVNESPPNQEPRTKNHKPLTKDKPKTKTALAARDDSVSLQTWNDFLAQRDRKKAPLTETALKGIADAAAKDGLTLEFVLSLCCQSGWASYRSGWYKPEGGQKPAAESFAERDRRMKQEQWQREKLAAGVGGFEQKGVSDAPRIAA